MESTQNSPENEGSQQASEATLTLPQQTVVPLTDGRKAIVKRGKGRLAVKANKLAGSPAEVPLALASLMTTINGQPIVYEDLLDMDLADTLAIQSAAMGLAGNGIPTAG